MTNDSNTIARRAGTPLTSRAPIYVDVWHAIFPTIIFHARFQRNRLTFEVAQGGDRGYLEYVEETVDTWFKREILRHEEGLMRFLSRVWRRNDELEDIRQEAYVRVFETAISSRPQNPKAFLFATARHLMADRIRRTRIVSIQAAGESDFLNISVDEISPEQRVQSHQELVRLAYAFDRLPTKCRQVVWLRRVKELSQREVAMKLGVTEKNVEKHLAMGGRLLVQYMRSNGLNLRALGNESAKLDDASDHEH